MTQIKLCGLSRPQDIAAANALRPDYIGFVFAKASRRYVAPETAAKLRALLDPGIRAVGVFVNETPEQVAALLSEGVIDIAQLHGAEDDPRSMVEVADLGNGGALHFTAQPVKGLLDVLLLRPGGDKLIARADPSLENADALFALLRGRTGGSAETFIRREGEQARVEKFPAPAA